MFRSSSLANSNNRRATIRRSLQYMNNLENRLVFASLLSFNFGKYGSVNRSYSAATCCPQHETLLNQEESHEVKNNNTFTLNSISIAIPNLISAILPQKLQDLFMNNGILWAVPKKKVTRGTKRIRVMTQFQKPQKNLNYCMVCGNVKLLHHLCVHCLKEAVVGKITETGDEFKGIPDDPLRHRLRRLVKARGFYNTLDRYKARQSIIKARSSK